MGMRKRCGFTLIELLVVIAIIGILAAMLFPVFARARESARKTQCLANVKNLAIAINMYLVDWDSFPPPNTDRASIAFFDAVPGIGDVGNCNEGGEGQWASDICNPYLQWPVVLDDYTKNRDIWKCPSARIESAAGFIYGNPNWLKYLQDNQAQLGVDGIGPACTHMNFPAGWGGDVTDSFLQHSLASSDFTRGDADVKGVRTFVQSIGAAKENLAGVKLSAIQDSAKLIVFADQPDPVDWLSIPRIAYPDICCAECAGLGYYQWGGWPDPNGCPDGSWCPDCPPLHAMIDWARDPNAKKAATRHLGGSNVGFGDGHAKWYAAQSLIAASDNGDIEGVGYVCPSSKEAWYGTFNCDSWAGDPDPGIAFLHNANIGWDGKVY